MPSDMQSDSSGPRARAPRKTLRHLFGPEQWTQRALIFLVCFWMLAAVVLPLLQVVERAVNADVSVAVFGDDDIRAAGHRIWVKPGGVLYIDDEPADLKNGRARRRGVSVSYNDDGLSVEVREMIYGGDLLAIKPVTARAKHEAYWINGKKLGPDEWQKTVRRSIGLKNFRAYFSNRALYVSLANSIKIALGTTFITVLLAFVYAYGLTRTLMPLKSFYRVVAMLPLFAPTMLYGLSLVYLFGNKGVITTGFFGQLPWLAADISLYGPVGIVISEVIFTFPPAMMILMVALSNMDARLYDAAASLGSTPLRTFRNVTLPGVRYGLMSAVFVCFTLSFTDFGAPKVVGGNYSVLAVDIYKQVIGQQNFGMGATVSIILLLPTFVSFLADRIIQRRQVSAMSACSEPLAPKRNRAADLGLFAACGLIAAFLLSMLFMAGYASLVKMWPYDFTLGFWHYKFADVGGGGYSAFWNSVRVSIITACVGAPLTFISAYLIDKTKGMPQLRAAGYFLSILPLALPGLEVDFLPGEEDETADIINSMIAHAASLGAPVSGIHGSMHLLPGTIDDGLGPKGDVQFVIWDLDAKIFETHLKDRGPKRILHDYFGALCELIDTGLYDALSHIELIRKFDQRNQAGHSVYFHDVEDLYDRLARDAIEKAAAANLAIEINVSGMARPIGRPFISQSLLNHAVACGAPICVGSDAHLPEHVGAYFDEAERMLESAGCDTLVTFNNRKQIPYKLT